MARTTGLKFNPTAILPEDFRKWAEKVQEAINKRTGGANNLEGYVALVMTGKAIAEKAEEFKDLAGEVYTQYGSDGMKLFGVSLNDNYSTKYVYSKKVDKLQAELDAAKKAERDSGKETLEPVKFPFRIN